MAERSRQSSKEMRTGRQPSKRRSGSGQLSTFLKKLAEKVGPESLTGAIVLVSLDRPIDQLIRYAEALDPNHRGQPSDWSHCFLIKEYIDGATTIFESTIRDEKTGGILWSEDLRESLEIISQPSGGIYEGVLNSPPDGYDDPRVRPLGVKLVEGLSTEERTKIVEVAAGFLNQGYHYDLPGLFRELIRFTMGITLPAGKKLLFCSAFVQAVYRQALGHPGGDFVDKKLRSVDVTPDDIWYSDLGKPILPKDV